MARFDVSDAMKTGANHWHGDTYWLILDSTTGKPAKPTKFFSETAARHEAERMNAPQEQDRYDRMMARDAALGASFHWHEP